MRQLKRDAQKGRQLRAGRTKRRAVIGAFAGALAIALLSAYLIQASGDSVPLYASSGFGSSALKLAPSGRSCVNSTVVPMNDNNPQSGITTGHYYITNDTWNAHGYVGLSQAIYVCSYNSWYAIATMNNDSGDGAVKTSPNVQETWYPTPTRLIDWASITSQFSDVPPGSGPKYGTWEFEYDIWLNGLADSKSTEIMIWTYNNGQRPVGSASGSFSDDGRTYEVFRRPGPYQYVAFVARDYKLAGRLNLLSFFNYVISKGWMPSSSVLYQICHGVELVSTNGQPERFSVTNFSVSMKSRA